MEDIDEIRQWTRHRHTRVAAWSSTMSSTASASAYDGSVCIYESNYPIHNVIQVVVERVDIDEALASIPTVGSHNSVVVAETVASMREVQLVEGDYASPEELGQMIHACMSSTVNVDVEYDAHRGKLRFRATALALPGLELRPSALLGIRGRGLPLVPERWVYAHLSPRMTIRLAYLECPELATAFSTMAPYGDQCLMVVGGGGGTMSTPTVINAAMDMPLSRVTHMRFFVRDADGTPLRDIRQPWGLSITLRSVEPEHGQVN